MAIFTKPCQLLLTVIHMYKVFAGR